MREVVLDTETTGLDPEDGHRIVEIGGVELVNHIATGQVFHVYINPQRAMPPEAEAIHGLGDDFLRDKPVFAEIAEGFAEFIGEAPLIIHNATFDLRFINAEFAKLGRPLVSQSRAIDTVIMARRRFPGQQANLDALCRRFGIDNSARDKHGALLDSELLAEVYLELLGGRQPDFGLSVISSVTPTYVFSQAQSRRSRAIKPKLTGEEAAAHEAFVATLAGGGRWPKL